LIVFARAGLGLKRGAPPDEALSPAAVKLRKQLEYQLKKKREEELWMKSKVYPREENESRRKIRFFFQEEASSEEESESRTEALFAKRKKDLRSLLEAQKKTKRKKHKRQLVDNEKSSEIPGEKERKEEEDQNAEAESGHEQAQNTANGSLKEPHEGAKKTEEKPKTTAPSGPDKKPDKVFLCSL
jgi:hypothetical protein